jgi:two-component system chemotaxis response regulator CheY
MKKIMIVDDSLIMRANLKRIFEKQGYKIIAEAANGQEAVEKYQKYQPDLVTMDITMPVLDGISALQKIRLLNSQACVIMISALGQELKVIESLNKGARHYILKPFKEADVISKVESILNDDNAEKEATNVCAAR